VSNAVRHSGATGATVTLRSANGRVTATIRDEGCGFEWTGSEVKDENGQVGLLGMQERASLVRGTVAVQSSPGRGTTIQVSIPVSLTDTGAERSSHR